MKTLIHPISGAALLAAFALTTTVAMQSGNGVYLVASLIVCVALAYRDAVCKLLPKVELANSRIEREVRLGREFAGHMHRQFGLLDPELAAAITCDLSRAAKFQPAPRDNSDVSRETLFAENGLLLALLKKQRGDST